MYEIMVNFDFGCIQSMDMYQNCHLNFNLTYCAGWEGGGRGQ